jgi:hypothetical protein
VPYWELIMGIPPIIDELAGGMARGNLGMVIVAIPRLLLFWLLLWLPVPMTTPPADVTGLLTYILAEPRLGARWTDEDMDDEGLLIGGGLPIDDHELRFVRAYVALAFEQ